MDRKDLSKTSFAMMKANEPKTREEQRAMNHPIFRGNLPKVETTINEVEKMWSTTGNWLAL